MATAERLYLNDPKATTFRTAVTDIREFARKDGVQVWHVALGSTAFYPTSGGQPHDLGVLKATSRSGTELSVSVDDVVEDDAGEVWHATTKPLLTGTEVEGRIDAVRRLDHTQQHSGQHLLSAVLAGDFGVSTLSFHLGESDATIDLGLDTKAAQEAVTEQLPEVEERVNRHITRDLPVSTRVIPNEEAQALLAAGSLRKLPPRSGPIRLVEIPGLDLNACGGTHVERLGEIGPVLLRETERIRKALRLHFVCGTRAVRAAREDWAELAATASMLSVSRSSVAGAVTRMQSELRGLAKERQRLREQIAESHAVQLAVEERIEQGLRLVCRSFTDHDADYIKLLAGKLLQSVPQTSALLVSTPAASGDGVASIVIASNVVPSAHLSRGCDGLLREVLAPYKLKGGGTAELAQAQVPADLLEVVTSALERRLSGRQ